MQLNFLNLVYYKDLILKLSANLNYYKIVETSKYSKSK